MSETVIEPEVTEKAIIIDYDALNRLDNANSPYIGEFQYKELYLNELISNASENDELVDNLIDIIDGDESNSIDVTIARSYILKLVDCPEFKELFKSRYVKKHTDYYDGVYRDEIILSES